MEKKVLTEQALYYGDVSMPKGFEINKEKLISDIYHSTFIEKEFPFSKSWDMLNTYIKDHIRAKHKVALVNKKTWGNIYKSNEVTQPLLNVDPVDLKNSPDFTMLYGVKTNNCWVRISYDDNRRKGRSWDIELKENMFVIFPATNDYFLVNNHKSDFNFVQTITYEFI